MNRTRRLLAVIAALALGAAACGGDGDNPAGNPSGGKVVVGSWGGDYQNFLKQFVEPSLDGEGAPSATYDTADQTARMTKMRAQKGKDGTIDAAMLGDTDMQQMIDAGVLDKIDAGKLSNYDNIRDGLTNDYWIPHIYSANVIIYNSDKVSTAPDSYSVLWDPKYKGRIGVLSIQWFNFYYAAAALVKNGDPGNNIDDGWEKLKELAGSVKVFSSQEQLGQAMIEGQVWLTTNWKARAFQWNKAGGQPLASVVPKEGTFPVIFAAAVPKNAPDKDAAYAYLNAMLDPDAQVDFAQNMGYSPTVDNAELPSDLSDQLSISDEDQALVRPVDYAYTAENDPRWRQQWEQEIIN